MYDVAFLRLLEVVEQSSEDMSKGMHAVICSPPYNTHWIAGLSNPGHDRLSLQSIGHFVKLLCILMDLSVHGHIFCSTMQFKIWYKLLVGEVDEVARHGEVCKSEEPATQVDTVFEMK